MLNRYNSIHNHLPNELYNYVFLLANNKCSVCHIACELPYKKYLSFIIVLKSKYFYSLI